MLLEPGGEPLVPEDVQHAQGSDLVMEHAHEHHPTKAAAAPGTAISLSSATQIPEAHNKKLVATSTCKVEQLREAPMTTAPCHGATAVPTDMATMREHRPKQHWSRSSTTNTPTSSSIASPHDARATSNHYQHLPSPQQNQVSAHDAHTHPRRRQALNLLNHLPVTTEDLHNLLQRRSVATERRLREAEVELAQKRMETMRMRQEMLQWRQAASRYRRERDVSRTEVEQIKQRTLRLCRQIQKVQQQVGQLDHPEQQEHGLFTQAETDAVNAAIVATDPSTDSNTGSVQDGQQLPRRASQWDKTSILKSLQAMLDDQIAHSIDHLLLEKGEQSGKEPQASADLSLLPSAKCICGCQEEIQAWKKMVARAEEKAEKARLAKHLSAVKFEQAKLQWSQWREKILAASRERKTRADKLAQKREQEHEEESQQERILRQNTDFNRNLTLHHLMEPPVLQDTETTHIVTSSASHYHHQHIDQHQHQHQRSQPRSQHVDVYQAYGDVAAEAMEIESDVGGDETSDDEDGSITEEMPASPVIHRPRRYLGKGREDGSKGQQPQSSMTFPSELAMCRRELSSDDDGSTDRDDMDNSNTTQRVSNTPVSPTNRAIRQSRSYRSPSVHVVDDGSPEHVPIVTGTAKNKVPTFESDMSSPLFDLERGDHLSDVEEIDMIPPAVVASTPTTSNTVSLRGLEDRVMKAVQLRPSTNERDQDPRCLQQQLAISDQLSGDDDDFQRPGANTNLRQRQQYQQQKPSMSTANNRRVIVPGTPRHAWPQTPQSKPLPRARQPQLHMVHSGAQQQYEGQSNAGDLSGEDLSEIEESKIETFNLNMESTTEVSMTAANAESTRPPPTKASTSAAVRVTSSSSSSGLLATGHAPTAASSTAVEGVAAVMTNVVESALETSATTPWETMAQAEPPERIYNYTERRKYKRKQMHADDCMCCRGYYEAVGPLPRPDGYSTFFDPVPPEERAVEDPSTSHMASSRAGMISVAARRQQASRHRVQHRERLTPPGFWIVGFPTAEEREEMNRVARERAQIRDGKRNRAG